MTTILRRLRSRLIPRGAWSAVLLVTLIALLPGAEATAAPVRALCRQACGALVAHSCVGLLGRVNHRCRRGILRRCRVAGPARCEEAQACDGSCGAIQAACWYALRGGSASTLACKDFAFDRCQQHGVAYCLAATTTVNGCNRVAAEDHRGEPIVTVTFSTDPVAYDYSPECIIVSVGAVVRFEGPFSLEPLVGGAAPNADPASPFAPTTSSGTARDFVLSTPGTFPYFGGDFGSGTQTGMFGLAWGAVIVDGD